MSSTFTKVATLAASAALVVAGAQAATAQTDVKGGIDLGSLQAGGQGGVGSAGSNGQANVTVDPNAPAPKSTGSADTGSLKAYGQSPTTGSLVKNDKNPNGLLDTSGSLLGEPTSGSLAGSLESTLGLNTSNPAPGTGSVDTSKGSLGEPTSGSLGSVVGPIGASLGTDTGITLKLGSSDLGGGSLTSVLPLVLVGGSIAAGIAAAPALQNLLPKPGPAPAVPGPQIPNGRG